MKFRRRGDSFGIYIQEEPALPRCPRPRPFDKLKDLLRLPLSSLSLRCVEPVETSKRTPRSPQPSHLLPAL